MDGGNILFNWVNGEYGYKRLRWIFLIILLVGYMLGWV